MTPDPDTVERMAEAYQNGSTGFRWDEVTERFRELCRERMAAAIQAQREHEEREAMR